MRSKVALISALLGLAACTAVSGRRAPEADPLLSSLQVTTGDGAVNLVLQVTNTTDDPIDLNFSSGQSYDFEVRQGGRQLWKWSGDRMFTSAMRSEPLPAGESVTYEERWQPPPGTRGTLVAIGRLTATEHRVEQSTTFDLP